MMLVTTGAQRILVASRITIAREQTSPVTLSRLGAPLAIVSAVTPATPARLMTIAVQKAIFSSVENGRRENQADFGASVLGDASRASLVSMSIGHSFLISNDSLFHMCWVSYVFGIVLLGKA